jgi:hypothetical protein
MIKSTVAMIVILMNVVKSFSPPQAGISIFSYRFKKNFLLKMGILNLLLAKLGKNKTLQALNLYSPA